MAVESASATLYFTPLFPASAIFHSHASSKLSKLRSEIRSIPVSGWPSGCTGPLPCSTCLIAPSSTVQRPVGVVLKPSPCQPLSVLPSNSSCQPSLASAAVSTLGARGDPPAVADGLPDCAPTVPATTHTQPNERIRARTARLGFRISPSFVVAPAVGVNALCLRLWSLLIRVSKLAAGRQMVWWVFMAAGIATGTGEATPNADLERFRRMCADLLRCAFAR